MAELQTSLAPRGAVYYSPVKEIEPILDGYLQPRRSRPQVLRIGKPRDLTDALVYTARRKERFYRRSLGTVNLVTFKDKRGSRLSKYRSSTSDCASITEEGLTLTGNNLMVNQMHNNRAGSTSNASTSSGDNMSPRGSVTDLQRQAGAVHTQGQSSISSVDTEKPVASGNGVSVSICLAEPVLFLQGFDSADFEDRKTAMLRGTLRLRVTKSAKIKAVTLNFKGKAETEWPEGIPPKKIEYKSAEKLMNHTWTFFNAAFGSAESTHGADTVIPLKTPTTTTREIHPGIGSSENLAHTPQRNSWAPTPKELRRLSLQEAQSKSFSKADTNVNQKGYRTFTPGDYIYNFELPLDSRLPETIDVELGTVKYELEAIVERSGAFRANLVGSKEVTLIRAPTEGSLETVEPIAISRDWEDQLHYDIVISGKSFPLGSQIPIAFKLTPLAKVRCHRIKVYITENIQYFTSNKRVHRLEPTRRIQLFEKRADGPSTSTYPGSSFKILAGGGVDYDSRAAAAAGDETVPREATNLLGRLEGEHSNVGPTELELNVQLPSCQQMAEKERAARLHFDTTYTNIQVHHWIKIVMRLSRPDAEDPSKQRHFEISIDSPFHILSCRATQANMSLPAYSAPVPGSPVTTEFAECGCHDAVRRRGQSSSSIPPAMSRRQGSDDSLDSPTTIAAPPAAHLHHQPTGISRPMHLLRAPSFNPPPWSDDDLPPPMVTPPPEYDKAITGDPRDALADYFARLADDTGSDDEGSVARRLDIPLTPGGRVNRSMDAMRTWMPVGTTFPTMSS